MSEDSLQELIHQIKKTQMKLKIQLEQVSKLRINCVRMQVDLLKLYKPRSLEILETLRDVSAPPEEPYDINGVELRSNETSTLPTSMRRESDYEAELPYEVHGSFLNHEAMTETTDAVTQTMELQENAPVFYSPTIITSQPEAGNSRTPRRPIPVNTIDWTTTQRPQLNSITGLQFLFGVEQLEIQQVIDLSTLLGRIDRGTQYRVKVPRAETLFLAMEAKHETTSRLCGWYKGFTLNVLDQCGETAFVIRKDPSWMHMPGSRQKITVESANLIGSVEENFSVIGPSFTVYNASKTPLCKIYGPNICGCCMYKEALFQIVSMDGTRQLASLIHQWDHLNVDYILLLTFPLETDVKLKSLLLGASFLIEYLYFQRIRRASRR